MMAWLNQSPGRKGGGALFARTRFGTCHCRCHSRSAGCAVLTHYFEFPCTFLRNHNPHLINQKSTGPQTTPPRRVPPLIKRIRMKGEPHPTAKHPPPPPPVVKGASRSIE
eukprot:jgi/Botrbrau1/3022/Bobra.0070s0018.1